MAGILALAAAMAAGLLLAPGVSANSDVDALTAFRRSLTDPEGALNSWDPTLVNACTWFHITCNGDNRVTRIDLADYNLSGSLTPELGEIEQLEYLELYSNNIQGSIPAEIGNLKTLKSLDLFNNSISGTIPSSLGNLKTLFFMRLNNNKLTGDVPQGIFSLPNLRVLDLSHNNLTGRIHAAGPFRHFPSNKFKNNRRLGDPEPQGLAAPDALL